MINEHRRKENNKKKMRRGERDPLPKKERKLVGGVKLQVRTQSQKAVEPYHVYIFDEDVLLLYYPISWCGFIYKRDRKKKGMIPQKKKK